ncbi:hypothetical protein AB0P17_05705 [Streptomyces sp. NPDC088124]|uniref:hypothetical protein n=1 Tax=Streptomyces sp. NPDC088124 TaxID=3154654 RepID=UPI003442D779
MYAYRDREANGARAPLARPPQNAAGATPDTFLSLSAMQTQAGNAATSAVLSGAAPVQRAPQVQRAPLQVQRGRERKYAHMTEEEKYQEALARERRAHERALRRDAEYDDGELSFGPNHDPFGGHTIKKGYANDKGPMAVTNKTQHPGSGKFSDRYHEKRPGKPPGFMSQLTDDDLGVAVDVLRNEPPDQDRIDSMGSTRRRASSTLYGASYSEHKRRPGSNKALRSALERQRSGKAGRDDFIDDFPMAGSVTHDGDRYGAQAYPKAQSGKHKLSAGAVDTLLEMSDSSDDGRGGGPVIVDAAPPGHSRPRPSHAPYPGPPPGPSYGGPSYGGPSYGGGPSHPPYPGPPPGPSFGGPSYGGPPPGPSYGGPSYGGPPPGPSYGGPSYGGPPPGPSYGGPSYGGPPPGPRGGGAPASEPVYEVNGRPCVIRNGQYVPIR